MNEPSANPLRRTSYVISTLAVLLAALAIASLLSGGFSLRVFGLRVSSHGVLRPALFALLCLAAAYRWMPVWQRGIVSTYAPRVLRRLTPWVAAAAAAGVLGLCWVYGTRAAGGSDSYGYVSQARLWLGGDLHVHQDFAALVPWPNADWSFTPLGYRPAANHTIVPTYAPGLPLLMAIFMTVAWQLRRLHHHAAGRGRAGPLDLRARSAGLGSCDRRARGTVDRQQSNDSADDAVADERCAGGRILDPVTRVGLAQAAVCLRRPLGDRGRPRDFDPAESRSVDRLPCSAVDVGSGLADDGPHAASRRVCACVCAVCRTRRLRESRSVWIVFHVRIRRRLLDLRMAESPAESRALPAVAVGNARGVRVRVPADRLPSARAKAGEPERCAGSCSPTSRACSAAICFTYRSTTGGICDS